MKPIASIVAMLALSAACFVCAKVVQDAETLPPPLPPEPMPLRVKYAPQARRVGMDPRLIARYGLTNVRAWPLNVPSSGCTNKEGLMP